MDQFSWSGTDSHTDVYESVDFLHAYYSYVHNHFLPESDAATEHYPQCSGCSQKPNILK